MRNLPALLPSAAAVLLAAGCCFQSAGEGPTTTGGSASSSTGGGGSSGGTAAGASSGSRGGNASGGTASGTGTGTSESSSGGGSSGGGSTGGLGGPCSLTVSPLRLNFGNVAPGETGSQVVNLSNAGEGLCQIADVALGATTDPSFALAVGQPTSFMLPPGSQAQIGLTFAPISAAPSLLRRGTLTFASNDSANPSVSVPLTAVVGNVTCYDCASPWPKWHADSFNTGYSYVDTSGLVGKVAWQLSIGTPGAGESYLNSPVIDWSDTVYQKSLGGLLYAVGPTGQILWTSQLSTRPDDPHPSTPLLLEDGSLLVLSGSPALPAKLFQLDARNGNVLFSSPYGRDGFGSCPNLGQSDRTLFLAENEDGGAAPFAAALRQYDGGYPVATLDLPATAASDRWGTAVAPDDSTYWASDGQFFGIASPAAGFTPMPGWPVGGVTLTTASTADANLIGTVNSDLALDEQTNDNVYAYSAWEDRAPDGGLYSVQGLLAALDPSTGATRWTVTLPQTALPAGWLPLPSDSGNAAPAIAPDGTVYVGNGDGLRAVDGATGHVKWLFPSANVSSSPAIGGDGTIFFGVDDGTFYALHPDGTLRFALATGGPISSSPAIGPDGTVVFVSDDGNLYAVQ
ncbi:MAG: outer membrane protein assembly factor BamB family protein [Myxococcales bacterium]